MILSVPIYVLKRRARHMARAQNIALSAALDQLARAEGYQGWSHLAAADAATDRAARVLAQLSSGDLVLLAARPGHGKTLMGLELLSEAASKGRAATFFSLEYTKAEIAARLEAAAVGQSKPAIDIDTSDTLSAGHVIETLRDAPPQTVAVIDYLQLLDQRRDTPPLADQIAALSAFARTRQITLICLSQIDRHFDPQVKALPDQQDIRLPNPVDLNHFDQMLFLHDGALRLRAA